MRLPSVEVRARGQPEKFHYSRRSRKAPYQRLAVFAPSLSLLPQAFRGILAAMNERTRNGQHVRATKTIVLLAFPGRRFSIS